MVSLTGLNGSITVDGRTVTIKRNAAASGQRGGTLTVLNADSIEAAVVWTGVGEGRFSLQYTAGGERASNPRAAEFLWIRFKPADKEWWDAMASAVMRAARRSSRAADNPAANGTAPVDAVPAAPPSFDGWLNRTLRLDT